MGPPLGPPSKEDLARGPPSPLYHYGQASQGDAGIAGRCRHRREMQACSVVSLWSSSARRCSQREAIKGKQS
eukprot:3187280-Amphidinium_carterae.1